MEKPFAIILCKWNRKQPIVIAKLQQEDIFVLDDIRFLIGLISEPSP